MPKQTRTTKNLVIIVVLLAGITFLSSGIILLSMRGCNSDAYKEDPNLSGHLKRLIAAEERGEAEEFAEQIEAELSAEGVTVIIECEPGQAEAVGKKAGDLGNVELIVRDLVQIVVPIPNLAALAEIPGVRYVRLPVYPVENE